LDTNNFNTLFTGKFLLHLEETESTNTYLKDWLTKNKPRDGAVILTEKQRAGRGQGDNSWQSEPGANITVSVLYLCHFLPALQQFPLSATAALAVRQTVADFLPDKKVSIKWPNDIFIDDKKVAGILIENALKGNFLSHSIIGIGLNVLQQDFSTLPNATSMSIQGYSGDKTSVLKRLLERLEQAYFRLKNGQFAGIKSDYESCMLGMDEQRRFSISDEECSGVVRGVDENGKLRLDLNGESRTFWHKEINWLFD
jgi:BirA family transcriptional regulator, biotin operon repressor / biotin---[acetyl-CoA-carboxylase] ligase